jgi:mannobiose 2-epimerase
MPSVPSATPALADLRLRAQAELNSNILPFWERHAFDDNGWLVATVEDDGTVTHDGPRHSVLVARILWTFAAAARVEADADTRERWLAVGHKALTGLTTRAWDPEHGGVYWSLDNDGAPLDPRKQVYAQAFAIYGLAEWHAATGDTDALDLAWRLFDLLEEHSRDPQHGGYREAHARAWGQLDDMALSARDLNVPKSMNTNLHVLEAYTTLARVSQAARAREALASLLRVTLDHIYGTEPWAHCRLFFDMEWNSVVPTMSYGHDIEASWLLWDAWDALEELGHHDAGLRADTRNAALALADAVFARGVDDDGGVMYEGVGTDITVPEKHWWPQAEGVVGWLNAYQLSGDSRHHDAALATWDFLDRCIVDHKGGEWFAIVDRDGRPLLDDPSSRKIGPWKCCYHDARACLEVIRRIDA